jgi:hypothetical protein
MASELSWSVSGFCSLRLFSLTSFQGMKPQYDSLGKPGIFRNDRFWLAGDHIVDPRIKDVPLVKKFVSDSENARDEFKMTEYQGNNVCSLPFSVQD